MLQTLTLSQLLLLCRPQLAGTILMFPLKQVLLLKQPRLFQLTWSPVVLK